ncbi:hypothetical protein cypCar_00029951, partial [Cyprinus carpio]
MQPVNGRMGRGIHNSCEIRCCSMVWVTVCYPIVNCAIILSVESDCAGFDMRGSEEVSRHGFTVIVDMRGSKWDSIKPLLKILQESFPSCIHVALIIKPDNFWQKQRTNFGSSKFEFE